MWMLQPSVLFYSTAILVHRTPKDFTSDIAENAHPKMYAKVVSLLS